MDELRKQAADLIVDRLKKISVAAAAADLGISRQAVYDIRKGKYCPSMALVQKACDVWNVKFAFRGIRIDSASFRGAGDGKSIPEVAKQADLFESLVGLDSSSFEVIQTKPVGRALEITLRLTLPARRTAAG